MPGEKDVIQKEAKPMDNLTNRPDSIKEQKENDSFSGKAGRGVF
jgi:hypothetical protein